MTTPNRLARGLLAGAAFLLTLVAAGSIPSRPLWWPHPKHAAHSVADVRNPRNQGMRQLRIYGYQIANPNGSPQCVIRAQAQWDIIYAVSLNADPIPRHLP